MNCRRQISRRRRLDWAFEGLESRRLLSGNIHLTNAYLTDSNHNTVASPVVGTQVFVRIEFTTVGLSAGSTYDVKTTFNGTPFSYNINWGAANPGTDSWIFDYGLFDVPRGGPIAVNVQLDPTNTVTETNESDNSASFSFTPVQLAITGPMAQPIGGVPERTYAYSNYTDRDPTSPNAVDYRGGQDVYDGHDGIDMTVPSFAYMDAGTPIYATLGGTVVWAQDGFYDRNTGGGFDANFVEIDSGNGYQEYYYHLREGSVGVKVGQTVQQGQVIGLMGASGNAFGAHLHFGLFNGGAVEPFQDPYTYWQNPAPYQGDVDAVLDSGITNYDPSSIMNVYERPPEIRTFKPVSQTIYAWFVNTTSANEPAAITFYRPNGTVYSATTYNTGNSAGGYSYTQTTLPAGADLGTWQVAMTVNGQELARNSFVVSNSGAAAVRVDQSGNFIASNRQTPVDAGSSAQGSGGNVLTFTVKNFGNANAILGSSTLPAGWIVTDPLVPTLAAGASDTFAIKLDTSLLGYRYGTVTFATGDPNNPAYSFAVSGTVTPTAATPVVSIYTRSSAAAETGNQPGIFRVTRTGDTTNALVVDLSISGSAGNGSDYSSIPNSVTIPAGQSTASVIITPIDDGSPESSEGVTIGVAATGPYTVGMSNSASITIADNDTTGSASISGTLYLDKNFNTYQDAGETGVSSQLIFLDNNANGVRDIGEAQTTSDVNGLYSFTQLAPGRYNVRIGGTDFINSTPVGSYLVTAAQALTANLGLFPLSFLGTNTADAFTILPAATTNRELITSGGVTYNAIRSQLKSLSFSGSGGNDTLTIDASLLSAPPGLLSNRPISFSGDSGTDALILTHTASSQDLAVQSAQASIGGVTITLPTTESVQLDGAYGSVIALHSLNMTGGIVSLSAGKNLVFSLSQLSISGGGKLDLTDNAMVLDYTNPNDPISTVRGYLSAGYNGGAWNGQGIFSSNAAAAAGTTLGIAEASDIGSPSSFVGVPIDGTAILIRYTLAGDATLDRMVDVNDLYAMATHWYVSEPIFAMGDFNGDGFVDGKDLGILSVHWQQTMVTPPAPAPPLAAAALVSRAPSRATSRTATRGAEDVL